MILAGEYQTGEDSEGVGKGKGKGKGKAVSRRDSCGLLFRQPNISIVVYLHRQHERVNHNLLGEIKHSIDLVILVIPFS